MDPDWGGCLYDHYARFLREPAEVALFRDKRVPHALQVLMYDNVFEACRVFCTLGLTHYNQAIGHRGELCVVADAGWSLIPGMLAKLLFFLVDQKIPVERGFAYRGFQRIEPAFVDEFQKPGLYIAATQGLPDAFARIECAGAGAHIWMGVFISEAEYRFFVEHGPDAFETRLAEANVDPFALRRPSAL